MFEDQSSLEFSAALAEKPVVAVAAKARRDAIKAAGGPEYDALLAKGRVDRAEYRRLNPDKIRASDRARLFRTALCAKARSRGRKRGLPATIMPSDLIWPTHCPVLGLALDYPERTGTRGAQPAQPNWPSLDRWDSTKGYVPGNVFVISYRANTLKNAATYEEILKVAKYLSRRPK